MKEHGYLWHIGERLAIFIDYSRAFVSFVWIIAYYNCEDLYVCGIFGYLQGFSPLIFIADKRDVTVNSYVLCKTQEGRMKVTEKDLYVTLSYGKF